MDPITHGFLGAAASHTVSSKKLRYAAVWIGAVAAMSPDLDIFIRSSDNPTLFLEYHRNFTHALAFVPVGALIIGSIFLLLFPALRSKWPYVLLGAFAAYLTHGLLDCATSYGTLWWWPFSHERVAWDLISIVDPVFTLMLIIGVLVGYRKQQRYPTLIALIACLLYMGFAAWQHGRAAQAQQNLAADRHQVIERGRVMPDLATLYRYRSVYIAHDRVYIDQLVVPLATASTVVKSNSIALFTANQLPSYIQQRPSLANDYTIFNWFSDGYVAALSQRPLVLTDLRYLRSVQPLLPNWLVEFPPQNDTAREHVYWQSHYH